MSVTLSDADYARLLDAAEADDMIVRCETCGAWADRDDPRVAATSDFTGCWFAATLRDADQATCFRDERPPADWRAMPDSGARHRP